MVWQYLQHEEFKDCHLLVWNEGEWERAVSIKIFGSSPPKPKECSSIKECKEHFLMLERELTKKYIIKRLAVKNFPSFQLRQELQEHRVTSALSKELITQFQNEGYIDDACWLRSFIAGQQQKKLASAKILGLLQQKGAGDDLIAAAEELLAEDGESDLKQCSAALEKLLKTKFRNFDPDDFKERQKVCRALASKGFSFDTIHTVINDGAYEDTQTG